MGERSGGNAVTASRLRAEDTSGDRALAESLSEVDLSTEMTRNELDQYQRAVIGAEGSAPDAASDTMMPVTITVPVNHQAGQALKVRMVDGSEYVGRGGGWGPPPTILDGCHDLSSTP